MNKKFITIGSVVLAIIIVLVAVQVLVEHDIANIQLPGSVPIVTTNLPSLGLNTLVVGNGCGFASPIPCTGNAILSQYGLTEGGSETLNATGTAYQLSATDVANFATTYFIATTSTTVTLPPAASFASSYLQNVGDRENWEFANASSTGGTITLAAGTNFFIQTNAASSTIPKTLVGSSTAQLTITRSQLTPPAFIATVDFYK